jgi:hypothetical protein
MLRGVRDCIVHVAAGYPIACERTGARCEDDGDGCEDDGDAASEGEHRNAAPS